MVDFYAEMNEVFQGQSEVMHHSYRWVELNHVGGSITDGNYFTSGEKAYLTKKKNDISRNNGRNDDQLWVVDSRQEGHTVVLDVVNNTYCDADYVRSKIHDNPRHAAGAPVLTANAIPIDRNGFLWVDIRERGLATYGGDRHTIGGAINPGEDSLDNVIRETGEELIKRDGNVEHPGRYLIGSPSPLAVLREPKTGYIQPLYAMRLDRTTRQLKGTRNEHEGTKEPICSNPDPLMHHVVSLANQYVPTGLAGLVIWGRDLYGDGWGFQALAGIRDEFRRGGEMSTVEAITA